jgi:hypothetical protein
MNRTKEQSSQALADRPARRGGLSARATGLSGLLPRTVRTRTADRPTLSRGLSEKANRTSSSEPRIMDRPWGARGLSARHPRTVRATAADCPKPLSTKARNESGSKTKTSTNTKNTRRTLGSRTVCQTPADYSRFTNIPRNSSTTKVNSPNSSPNLPNGRSG